MPEKKEPEVLTNPEMTEEQVTLEQGYYNCVYVILRFKKDVSFESNEEQPYVEDGPDEEEMEYVKLYYERERHCRMVFKDNDGGVDNKKALLHAKRWGVYVNEKENIMKGGYLVEVVCYDGKKVLWELVDNHVVEQESDHDEIGLRGFDLNLFGEDGKGVGREGSSEFPYLPMLIKLCPGYQKTQLKRTNLKMNEDNDK